MSWTSTMHSMCQKRSETVMGHVEVMVIAHIISLVTGGFGAWKKARERRKPNIRLRRRRRSHS